jgi:SPP1 family predicted phage head-tail adaptor
MTYDCEIELIKTVVEENRADDIGDSIEIKEINPVLASKINYRNKEYYQALKNGLKPSIIFGINENEYNEERTIKYQNRIYKILDVYPIKEKYANEFESLALLCEAVI